MTRRLGIGVVVALVYVVVAMLHLGTPPVRTLFDGVAPPTPYNWVSPPPELATNNREPDDYRRTLKLGKKGSPAASIATSDGQATVIAQDGTFARAGANRVRVRITPLDPAKIGSPPSGSAYAGNAYRFAARYLPGPGNSQAPPRNKVTILLRYPSTGDTIARREGPSWTKIRSNTLPATLQLFADTRELGTFVALHPGRNPRTLWLVAGIASGIAAALGVFLGLRDRRAQRRAAS
jgi:hypothetical protein